MLRPANCQVHYGDSPPPGSNTQSVRVDAPPPGRNPAPVYAPVQAQKAAPVRGIADERQALNDKALMENCRAARNSYCDEGVAVVRQKNYEHEQMQAAAQQGAALERGRVIPPSQRIQPTPPCQWPQTCTGKK